MTERDQDRAELEASREAIRTAKINAVKTDAAVETLHRTSEEIRSVVQPNGYLERFRAMIRGAA